MAGAIKDLKAQGKVLALGLSEMGLEYLAPGPCRTARCGRAERVFDALARPREGSPAPVPELGIGFVPWSPLGVGFSPAPSISGLTADGDFRKTETRFSPGDPRNLAPAAREDLGRAQEHDPCPDCPVASRNGSSRFPALPRWGTCSTTSARRKSPSAPQSWKC